MTPITDRYLEISYRQGKPFAAYLFLPRRPDNRSAWTERFSEVLIIDYAADGRAIGIEIVHPQHVTEDQVNRALAHIDQPPLDREDFAPLKAVRICAWHPNPHHGRLNGPTRSPRPPAASCSMR